MTRQKTAIKVFLTKSRKIRAKIQGPGDQHPYEVTVGGESWENGKGREHEEIIRKKSHQLLEDLLKEVIKNFIK